ncbi:MAG TPA: L,D-transpeptidase family protein [Trebonia sp.]|nr:L,D-transpeptidase family protein [Trebonia sp.]
MGALTHGSRLAKFGVTAAAVAAIALCGCTAGTALAAPSTAARPAAVTASAAKAAPSATATEVAKVTPATYVAPKRTLAEGMTGADVKSVQRRLAALKYWPGPIDGQFGTDTLAAVWAFQEINGIKVTGVIDTATKKALVHPRTYKSASYKGKRANRIEVSQALEVLVLYKNNKIWLISHVSSGGGYYYNCGSSGCAQAVTPNGTYNTTVYMDGWVKVPLGAMYNPVFFISTVFAIHGDTYVPQGPASHGCVRIPMDVANFFHKMVKTPGTQVHVYGKPQWQK